MLDWIMHRIAMAIIDCVSERDIQEFLAEHREIIDKSVDAGRGTDE